MPRHTPEQETYGAACVAVLREVDRNERPAKFATHRAWATKAKVSPGTLSDILSGHQLPTSSTARALAKAVGIGWSEFQARARVLSTDAVAFQGNILPSTLAQVTPPGLLLRWASYALVVLKEELLGGNALDGTPLVSVVLARASKAFKANIDSLARPGVDPALRHHPLVQTPFMYMTLDQASRLQHTYTTARSATELLMLSDWAMELRPATFGLVALHRELLQETELSGFHRAIESGQKAAREYLCSALGGKTVVYEYPSANEYLNALEDFALARASLAHDERRVAPTLFKRKITGFTSGALQLMGLELLNSECVLAVQHAHLWAIRSEPRSRFHLLFTNEGSPLPSGTLDPTLTLPPYDVITVRHGGVRKPALEMAARYYAALGRKLIVAWKDRPQEVQDFLTGELDKYLPGIGYSPDALRGLVDEGLKLHVGDGVPMFIPVEHGIERLKVFHATRHWPPLPTEDDSAFATDGRKRNAGQKSKKSPPKR